MTLKRKPCCVQLLEVRVPEVALADRRVGARQPQLPVLVSPPDRFDPLLTQLQVSGGKGEPVGTFATGHTAIIHHFGTKFTNISGEIGEQGNSNNWTP